MADTMHRWNASLSHFWQKSHNSRNQVGRCGLMEMKLSFTEERVEPGFNI
jgi:hypothetical protein